MQANTISKSEKFYNRSLKSIKQGSYEQARKWLKVAKSYGYPIGEIHYQIGIISLEQLKLKQALQYLHSYISLTTHIDKIVFYHIGEIYYILGNNEESIFYFRETLSKGADILTQCKALLYLYHLNHFSKEKLKDIIGTQFQYLFSLGQNTLEQKRVGAIIASLNGQHQRAIELASKVIEERPGMKEGYKELLQCYMEAKQYKEIIKLIQENKPILKIDKTIHLMLAKAFYFIGKLNECKQELLILTRFLPGNARIYYNLANILYKMKQSNRAGHYYLKAIQYDPRLYQAYFNLGVIYHKNGMIKESEHYYTQANQIAVKLFESSYNLGLLFYQKQDYFNSLESFLKTLKINNNSDKTRHNFNMVKNLKLIDPDLPNNERLISKTNFYFIIIIIIIIILFISI